MKVKYIGQDIGVDGLRNGNVYDVIGVDNLTGYLLIIDESGEDYLYHPKNPKPIASTYHPGGIFEIVEDNELNDLKKAIYCQSEYALQYDYIQY